MATVPVIGDNEERMAELAPSQNPRIAPTSPVLETRTEVMTPAQDDVEGWTNVYRTQIQQERQARDEQLQRVLNRVVGENPDQVAELQRLQQQTGLPQVAVTNNLEELRRRAAARQAEERINAMYNPVLARQMTDPEFAALAHDDIFNLGNTTRLLNWASKVGPDVVTQFRAGRAQVGELSDLQSRAQMGLLSPQEWDRMMELREQQQDYGPAQTWVGETAKVVGQQFEMIPEAAEFGAYTGMTAATTVAIAGQLGPQIATPEELVTVPTTFIGGFFAGFTAKMAEQTYRIESGEVYVDLIEEGVDPTVARYASVGVGLVNASLEAVGVSIVASPFKKALSKVVTQRVSTALTRPSLSMATMNFAKTYATIYGTEVAQEMLQELSAVTGEELARAFNPEEMQTKMSTPEGREEIADRLTQVLESTAQAMILLAGAGPTVSYVVDARTARQAEETAQFFDALSQDATQSKVRQRNPDRYQQFIAAQVNGTAAENVYIDAEQLNNVLRQNNLTVDDLAAVSPEAAQQLQDVANNGGDVVIPTSQFAAKIAGTKVGNDLQQHMRLDPEAMSAYDATQFAKQQDQMRRDAEAALNEQSKINEEFGKQASAVRSTVLENVKATRTYSDKVASDYAEFVKNFVVTQSAQMNMMPQEFYEKYMYRVQSSRMQAMEARRAELFGQDGQVNVQSNAFQEFYGQSVFRDEQGKPQVLYHGTPDDVSAFDLDHPNRKDSGWLGTGVYLTDNPDMAGIYADQKARAMGPRGQNVMPLYARLENPYYASIEEKARIRAGGRQAADAFTEMLREEGHDGVILQIAPDAQEIVVFEPSSVKSVFNSGTWSRETTDLLAQRGKEQKPGRVVPDNVLEVSNVESAFQFASTQQFKTNREFKLALQKRVLDAAKAGNVDLSDFTVEVERYLVKAALEDAFIALETNPNAVGWYNEKVSKALAIMSLVHPEVATDQNAKFAFTWALAVTSNGLKVDKNFELAESAYRYYKENGVMPTNIQAGQAQAAINEGMALFNDLVAKHGMETVMDFMTTRQTVKQVTEFTGKKVNGENLMTEVYGAAAVGPKIGNGFFANLYGHFEQLTMDRWFMRTWGRYTGTLVQDNPKQVKAKREQLKALIKAMSPADKKAFEAIIKTKLTLGKVDEVAQAINKASTSPKNRQAMAMIGDAIGNAEAQAKFDEIFGPAKKSDKRISYGDQMRLVGNALTKYLDGQKEAPSGPPERARIRKVMQQVLTELQQVHPDLTMSDLQALLWYPEKRLYDSAKTVDEGQTGYEDNEAPDYANAAAATARSLGVSEDLINLTIQGVDNVIANERAARTERADGDGLLRQRARAEEATVVFEVAPDPNNFALADRWRGLTTAERLEASVLVAQEVVPSVLQATGAKGNLVSQVGSYFDDTNPSFAIKLTSGDPVEVARGLGFALSQDSMMVVSPTALPTSFKTGAIRINIGEQTAEQIDSIYQTLRGIQGFPQIQGQTTTEGFMTIMLDPSVDPAAMATAIDQALNGEYTVDFASIHAAFPEKQEYDYADSRNDPEGSEGLARQRYRNARAEATAAINRILTGVERAAARESFDQRSREDRERERAAAGEPTAAGGITDGQVQPERAGDGRGRYSGGGLTPLEGAPTVEGATGPDARLVAVAEQYARDNGIDLRRQSEYVEVDPARAQRIADAYEAMQHTPNDPVVQEAYQNLIDQTVAQYRALEAAGYQFYFFDETNDPYAGNPWEAMRDLRANQTMGVFSTEAGFGTSDFNVSDNPLLADTGITWPDGSLDGPPKRVLANDLFRAVHDAFGHGLEGAGFRARGEENAWQAHVRLFTGSAVGAITSETRGQNSWLNYGPFGEANQTANVFDTVFADQKTGLMPEWTWTEGRAGDMADVEALRQASEADARQRAMLDQTARGAFDPRKLTTILYEDADYSTFLHETAHFFLTVYADMAALPDAPPQVQQDMQALLDWFGVKDLATWNAMSLEEQRRYHEQFAYNFEIYLFEGNAPSVQMQGLFDRFSAWLRDTYKSIRDELNALYKQETGNDLPILTGEVRSVMDRMVASQEQIEMAQNVRQMKPMFQTQEQSGMNDQQWAEYQEMMQQAEQESITDLSRASVRQMKWLANARSRVIKELQKEAENTRKKVAARVTEEVRALPVYRAMEFFKRGMLDGQPVDVPVKLSIAEIEAMYGKDSPIFKSIKETLKFGKYGMLGTENGIHPDQAAEMLNYPSGYAMVQDLLNAKPMKEAIDERVDRVMLEEYGDMADQAAMDRKVEEALHNEARARFVAAELRWLSKVQTPVRVMQAAARQVAQQILNRKRLGDIRVREFTSAEAKAAKAANAAMKAGKPSETVRAKKNQLVQNQLAKEALKVRQEIDAAIKDFRKFFKADKRLAKTRNMDLVDAARAILSFYELGPKSKSPVEFIEKLKAYNADLYAELEPIIIDASTGAKSYKELTLQDFRALRDGVEALWFRSRRDNIMMVEGKSMELDAVIGELNTRLEEIGIPGELPGEVSAPTTKDRVVRQINATKAILRRVEHWADATDGPKGVGPFTRYIWRPVRQALDEYRVQRNNYVKRYVDLVRQIEAPVGKIEARELGYTFGNANGGIGKFEVLGAMLHAGNESNLRKLLLGRGWGKLNEDGTLDASRWSAFMERMFQEKIITKQDMDWVQAVWDLNEEMKPMAQKAHKDIFGYYFNEVEASPVTTPFGVYRGGYVPAKTDPFMVRDAQKNAKIEQLESDFRNSMPSTGMGFTKNRVEYNQPLSLDIRIMTKHIDDVIRFAFVQPAIKDVLKIVRKREFSDNLSRIDPSAVEEMLLPWLNRAARQITMEPGMHKAVDAFWQGVRKRTGIGIMFANITNALQQVTGYFPALLKTQAKYMRPAMALYMSNPSKTSQEVAEMSPFMDDRMNNRMFELQEIMNEILLNPTKFKKIQQWSERHGYFLQQAFQNQVDTIVWMAKYNEVLATLDKSVGDVQAQKEAIAQADAVVRMTQDSYAVEDVAAFQVGTPFYKTFTQFAGYFNMLANLNGSEYVKVIRDLGFRGNKGKLFSIYLLGFMAPMLVSEAIVKTLAGDWDDEDDDGYIDEVAEWFFMSQIRGAVAGIPAFGPGLLAIGNAFNNKPYDDRMTTSPSVSMLEGATIGVAKTVINIVDPDKEVTGKNVRDVLTLLSLVTGIPLMVLGRPLGYAVDVERGRIDPTSDVDYVRGLITGKASEESR